MKIYLTQNVYEAALDRMRRLFWEFPTVVVNCSGGKDSTVVLNLALQVAEELGRLPLPVFWIDQEAEWSSVVEYVRGVMYDPRVRPYWLQVPFRINNSTSGTRPWLHAWEPGGEWIRDKDPIAIHDNTFGEDLFANLFEAASRGIFGTAKRCHIAGVRAEESPARLRGLTAYATYQDITWGNKKGERWNQWTFYPIYDWGVTDVWHAIESNGWAYTKLYDLMYQHGVPLFRMRVSNVHHETALEVLTFLQELEPDTWNRICERLPSVNAMARAGESYRPPKVLPPMFSSWEEYRDHLLENLIVDPAMRESFRKQFRAWDGRFEEPAATELLHMEVAALLVHDFEGTKFKTFLAAHGKYLKGRNARGRRT